MRRFKPGDLVEVTKSSHNNTGHHWYVAGHMIKREDVGSQYVIEAVDYGLSGKYGWSDGHQAFTVKINGIPYGTQAIKLIKAVDEIDYEKLLEDLDHNIERMERKLRNEIV